MEERQIESLYTKEGPGLLGYFHRLAGDEEAARDLLQETFVTALQFPERMATAVSPRAWLFGVARNIGLTWARRRRPMAALTADVAAPAQDDSQVDRMLQAIAELPDAMRDTLQLRLAQELSYQEIATVMGVPIGTVRSRIHNAVGLLRMHLAGADEP
jgi:RNA polymerase sigma-70 factor (ECF subfamily)